MPGSVVGIVGAIVPLVLALNLLTAFHSTAPDEVCVVQEGGPLDGRGVAEIRQPGEGVKNRRPHGAPAGLQSLGGNAGVLLNGGNR
jgi:hypothetical protein